MIRIFLFLAALMVGSGASAAPLQQLSFEFGSTVLSNPSADAIVLRSAGIDRVRLQLFKLPDDTAENQIAAARLAQSVTENGLLLRATEGRAPAWQADFILPDDVETVTQPVPLMAAAGQLASGDYVLVASGGGASVAQWFGISPVTIAHTITPDGQAHSAVVERASMKPVPNAIILALNTKGEVVGGARAAENGMAVWAVPPETIAVRGEIGSGTVRPHVFTKAVADKPVDFEKNTSPLSITTEFENNVVPAGATARFTIMLKNGGASTVSYVFAQDEKRYEWQRDAAGLWQYRTIRTPSAVQRGTITTNAKGVAELALPVGEGRYRLTVSGAGQRSTVAFTAGWWRSYALLNVACTADDANIVTCTEQH